MLNFRSVLKIIYFPHNTFFLPSFSFEVIDFQSCRRSRTLPLIGSGRNANTESLVNNAAAATSIGGGVWLMSWSWPVFGSRPANAWPHHVQWGQSVKLTFINGAQLTHHIWNPDWRMSDSGPGAWGWPGPLCFSVNDGVDGVGRLCEIKVWASKRTLARLSWVLLILRVVSGFIAFQGAVWCKLPLQ